MTLAYDDRGVGQPVILLHAFPLHRGMWSGVRAVVGDELRLIVPDFPGFGDSPAVEGDALLDVPTLDAYVDGVATLIARLRVRRAVVGGLSMGGYVALAFARRHPDLLLGLVLADTKASADTPTAAENRLRIASLLLEEESPRVLVEESVPNLLGSTTKASRQEVVAAVRSMVEGVDPAAAAWAQRAMAGRTETFDALRELTVPVAVIVGAEDVVTPPADAEALAAVAADATLTVLPGVGHLSAIEDPAGFATALRSFLSRF